MKSKLFGKPLENSTIYLFIGGIQCACGLGPNVTIPFSEAHGIRAVVVVNKTPLNCVSGTIYFNQICKVLEMVLVVLVRTYSFGTPTGPSM